LVESEGIKAPGCFFLLAPLQGLPGIIKTEGGPEQIYQITWKEVPEQRLTQIGYELISQKSPLQKYPNLFIDLISEGLWVYEKALVPYFTH